MRAGKASQPVQCARSTRRRSKRNWVFAKSFERTAKSSEIADATCGVGWLVAANSYMPATAAAALGPPLCAWVIQRTEQSGQRTPRRPPQDAPSRSREFNTSDELTNRSDNRKAPILVGRPPTLSPESAGASPAEKLRSSSDTSMS